MKRLLISLLALMTLIVPGDLAYGQEETPRPLIFLDGKEVEVESDQAFIKNDRTYLPLRRIAEELDLQVDYNKDNKDITIKSEDINLLMNLSSKAYKVNEEEKTMDVKPLLVEDRTYVPVRFVAEAFGKEVQWDSNNGIVIIGDFKTNKNPQGQALEFRSLGLTMYADKKFEEKIDIRGDLARGQYEFFLKDTDQFLASISRTKNPMVAYVPGYILAYKDGVFLEINFASDVQYDENTKEAYLAANDLLIDSIRNIEIKEDFNEIETIFVYIKAIDLENKLIKLDPVEYLTLDDEKRLADLGIDSDKDLPNGFYIYNEKVENIESKYADDLNVSLKEAHQYGTSNLEVKVEDLDKFQMDHRLMLVVKAGGDIIEIKEQYLP